MDGRGDQRSHSHSHPKSQMAGRWTSRPSYLTYPKLDGVVTRHYWRKLKSGVVRKGRRYTIFWGAGEMARRYRADEREEAEGEISPPHSSQTQRSKRQLRYRTEQEARYVGVATPLAEVLRGRPVSGCGQSVVCPRPPTQSPVASRQSPHAGDSDRVKGR